jgi:hypothetical protein
MTLVIDNVENEGLSDFQSFRAHSTQTTTSASTLILDINSDYYQFFIGTTAGQVLQFPNATTLQTGHTFWIWNGSTQIITIKDAASVTLASINANFRVTAVLRDNSTAAGIWLISITTGSSFSGVSGIIASYNGNANVGRYLEIFPGIDSLTGPYYIPTNAYIVAFTFSAIANSTGTCSLFKTSDLVTPLVSLSLSASKNVSTVTLNVALNAGDLICARITSGSINKPYIVWYITGG